MIRAAFLDRTIYAELAASPALQQQAYGVAAAVILLGGVGYLLVPPMSRFLSPTIIISEALLQTVAWFVRIWVIQWAVATWLKQPTTFSTYFRVLSFAQSPAVLGFLPLVGQLLGLWAIVSAIAAVRDVAGTSYTRAAALAIGGYVAGGIALEILGRLIGLFR
jgi:hypothetical protein